METVLLQIIKALNLYRKKTGSDNYFWVMNVLNDFNFNKFKVAVEGFIKNILLLKFVDRFI